jgi:hypothetical protein
MFWRNVSPPSSGSESKPCDLLLAGFLLGLLFDSEGAICSSETSVDFYLTTQSYDLEDCSLQKCLKFILEFASPWSQILGSYLQRNCITLTAFNYWLQVIFLFVIYAFIFICQFNLGWFPEFCHTRQLF